MASKTTSFGFTNHLQLNGLFKDLPIARPPVCRPCLDDDPEVEKIILNRNSLSISLFELLNCLAVRCDLSETECSNGVRQLGLCALHLLTAP